MTTCDMCGELAMNTLTLCSDCRDHVNAVDQDDDIEPFEVSEDEFNDTQFDEYY